MTRLVLGLVLLILAVLALSLVIGDEAIPIADVAGALSGGEATSLQARMIVLDIRLPRVLLALLVGIALAVAGTITQTVLRNPLAEPGLLGINAGAALAALVLIVHFENTSAELLPWAALGGALVMAAAIYLLSWRGGASSIRLILIGIGLSALAGAGSGFITAFGDIDAVQRAQVWLAGSVYDARWEKVRILAAWTVLPVVVTVAMARELDLMALEETSARSLGQPVELVRAGMILLCTLAAAAAVAAAGLIGFIGLVAPHAARRLVGARHARRVPVAALVGGLLVMAADLVGRTIIAPAQLPAGLMTALIGAPFFAYLLWERRDAVA